MSLMEARELERWSKEGRASLQTPTSLSDWLNCYKYNPRKAWDGVLHEQEAGKEWC